jgi:hypothetical protein
VIDRLGRGLSAVAGHGSGSLRDLGITKGSTPKRRWQVGHGASLGCSGHDDQAKGDPSIAMAAIPHEQGRCPPSRRAPAPAGTTVVALVGPLLFLAIVRWGAKRFARVGPPAHR